MGTAGILGHFLDFKDCGYSLLDSKLILSNKGILWIGHSIDSQSLGWALPEFSGESLGLGTPGCWGMFWVLARFSNILCKCSRV